MNNGNLFTPRAMPDNQTLFKDLQFQVISRTDLPWMRNDKLVHHMLLAIMNMILFLFQRTTLVVPVSAPLWKGYCNAWKTYVRSATNNRAAAKAR